MSDFKPPSPPWESAVWLVAILLSCVPFMFIIHETEWIPGMVVVCGAYLVVVWFSIYGLHAYIHDKWDEEERKEDEKHS